MHIQPTAWFVRREFGSAAELIDALAPHAMWGDRPDWWIYRGQGDASWDLDPSAFRELTQFDYGLGPYRAKTRHRDQIVQEALLVRLFVSGINEQGGDLPTEAAFGLTNWHEIDRIISKAAELNSPEGKTVWPPPDLEQLFALGQHYGLPTRLLDWTERGRVAAYFAAEAARRKDETGDSPSHIAVWAYSAVHEGADEFWRGSAWHPRVVRVPRSRNPNLHAQGGVFTVLVNAELGPEDEAKIPPLNRLIVQRSEEVGRGPREVPLLYQLLLESRHTGELLRLLRYEQISSTYLFPGYEGVLRGIAERRLWDRVNFPWDY